MIYNSSALSMTTFLGSQGSVYKTRAIRHILRGLYQSKKYYLRFSDQEIWQNNNSQYL